MGAKMLSDVLRRGVPVLLALAVLVMQPATQSAAKATSTEPDSGKSTSKAINPGEVRVAMRTRSAGTNSGKATSRTVSKQSVSKQNVSRVKRSSGKGKIGTSKSGSGKTSTKKAGVTNKGDVGQSGTGKTGKAGSTKTGTGTNSTSGTSGKIGTGPGQIGSGAKTLTSTSTRAQIKAGLDAHPGVPVTAANPAGVPLDGCNANGCTPGRGFAS
jgi:cytoskeletal protein RodZ